MATRLTKAELLIRIEQLEQELGMAHKSLGQMTREVDAFYVRERPSRNGHVRAHRGQFADTQAVPIQSAEHRCVVYLRGVPHAKVKAMEGGRLVTTYKPLAPVAH